MPEIPTTMKRLVLVEANEDLAKARIEVEECPVPKPSSSEVLVKVAAAPVNPSDYGAWKSKRGEGPQPIGNEGSGVVVAVGSSSAAWLAGVGVGTTVGFVGARGQGSYSEYVAAPIKMTFAMPRSLPAEDAASFFVNPFTAYAILADSKGGAFVHTAAASQLGQMLVKLCALEGAAGRLINVVRSERQVAILEGLGAKHVVLVKDAKTDADGVAALKAKMDALHATIAFDAVAGAMAGALLSALPKEGTLVTYGKLAGPMEGLEPIDLIYHGKKVEGLFLKSWLMQGFPGRRLMAATSKVRAGLHKDGGWCASAFADCGPDDMWAKFLDMYTTSGFTDRKLRVRF